MSTLQCLPATVTGPGEDVPQSRNKESERQRYESKCQTYFQVVLRPENTVEIARQMQEAGHLSNGLSQSEKNAVAYKLMTDQLSQMKRQLEVYKNLPDCSELQGNKGQ